MLGISGILSYAVFVYLCICNLYLCIWQSRILFLMSLGPWLFQNISHVGYLQHFITGCICVFVNLYLCICVSEYQNIIFDVLGPLVFQKYSIIRFYKVFWHGDKQTNEQSGEPRGSPLVEQWTELTFVIINNFLNCTSQKRNYDMKLKFKGNLSTSKTSFKQR